MMWALNLTATSALVYHYYVYSRVILALVGTFPLAVCQHHNPKQVILGDSD